MSIKMISIVDFITITIIVSVTFLATFQGSKNQNNADSPSWISDNNEQILNSEEIQTQEIDQKIFQENFTKSFQCKGHAHCILGFVTRIIDGDTIVVDDKSIRFALVNTPEWGDKNYIQSGKYIETICPVGSQVLVDEDDGQTQRSFGRIIGKIYCNGYILNEAILESKHAVILTQFCSVSEFANESWAKKFGC